MAVVKLIELAYAKFPDLTEAEHYLVECISSGMAFNCDAYFESDLAPSSYEDRLKMRIQRAELIVWLCMDSEAQNQITKTGIEIFGARIEGSLEILAANSSKPLTISNSIISGGFDCVDAHFKSLDLSGTQLEYFYADRVNVSGNISLCGGFTVKGELRLPGAIIGGNLDCSGAKCQAEDGDAIVADRLEVSGSVFLREGFSASGQINLTDATIGGDFDCSGGQFLAESATNKNITAKAISADRIKVEGNVYMRGGFSAVGGVSIHNAEIDGALSCAGGTFQAEGGEALFAEGVMVVGGVFLRGAFKAKGAVRLSGAVISGDLSCDNGTFQNEHGDALAADHIKLTGNLTMRNGFLANGVVLLQDTSIGGGFACDGGKIHNEGGTALSANRLKVRGHVTMRNGFEAIGAVLLEDAALGGHFACDGALFSSANANTQGSNGNAIYANRIKVTGNLFLRAGFRAIGGISLQNALITGDFSCENGHFESANTPTISAVGIMVVGSVLLRGGFTSKGTVVLKNAEIGGNLACDGGTFGMPQTDQKGKHLLALDASQAKIAGNVIFLGGSTIYGMLSFAEARIEQDFQWNKIKEVNCASLDMRDARAGILLLGKGTLPTKENCFFQDFKYSQLVEDVPQDAYSQSENSEAQPVETSVPPEPQKSGGFSAKISQMFKRKE